MKEIFLIIQREYLSRVCAKSFIIITLLTPFLLSSIFVLPALFSNQNENYKQLKFGLINTTSMPSEVFNDLELNVESLENHTINDIKNLILSDQWEGIMYVEKYDSIETIIQYHSAKQPSIFLQNQIKSRIQQEIVNDKLNIYGIHNIDMLILSAKESVTITNIKVGSENTQIKNNPHQRFLCMILGVIIYLSIVLFSTQVMRGVLEEKSNRIIELIITSISPVKFMIGKIIGIALLGLTQFTCWLVITYCISFFMSNHSDIMTNSDFINQRINQEDINQLLNNLNQIDFNIIIPMFLFFFIGGYLLYSSLFAAIAAIASDHEEIQQITTIVTIPLVLSFFVLTNTVNSPDSSLSYWFSIIPFTSPVIMVGRIVYGVPLEDVILSMTILVATIILIVWLSGKVYQTTILHTGRRLTVSGLITWIKNINK